MRNDSNSPTVTARYDETAETVRTHNGPSWRIGMDVTAEIVYQPGETHAALAAVDRLATDLRRQIADAAERLPAHAQVSAACRRAGDAEVTE